MSDPVQVTGTIQENKPWALADVLSRGIRAVDQFARKPFGYDNPPAAVISDAIGVPSLYKTLDKVAYGYPITEGRGQTFRIPAETLEATPLAAGIGKVAAKGVWNAAGKIAEKTPLHGQTNMFLGPSAKNADLHAMKKAEELELTGTSPEDIWTKTGWFRGPDDKWRFEISDHNVAFRGMAEAREQRPKEFQQMGVYDSAIFIRERMERGMSTSQIQKEFQQAFGHKPTIMEQNFAKNNVLEDLEKKLLEKQTAVFAPLYADAERMLPHEELFENYPGMRKMGFRTENMNPTTNGYFEPYSDIGAVALHRKLLKEPEQARSTGLHEFQHSVQHQQGFEPGASMNHIMSQKNKNAATPEDFARKVSEMNLADREFSLHHTAQRAVHEMHSSNLNPQIALEKVLSQADHFGNAKDFYPGGELYNRVINLMMRNSPGQIAQSAKEAAKESKRIYDEYAALKRPISEQEGFRLYRRSMGETEARVVQLRRDLTPEERRANFPMKDFYKESPRGLLTEADLYDPNKVIK